MKKNKTDLREIEEIVKDPSVRGVIDKKKTLISTLSSSDPNPIPQNPNNDSNSDELEPPAIDSASALQLFLDHIPISSIPAVKNSSSSFLEFKTQEYLIDAIRLLYERNVFGAPIADVVDSNTTTIRSFTDGFIGFIDFASLVLWCLEESEKHQKNKKDGDINAGGFFSMLEQIPHIGQTKIGELAKLFLWDPFFPVNLDDTLFNALLLLSKHRLHVVPVITLSESKVVGFITQIAVVHTLFQSSGLEWFDNIAEKPLSEFRFENGEHVVSVCEDESIANAMHMLWQNRSVGIAVIEQKTHKLVGCIRSSDVYLILDNNALFDNRKSVSVGHFIKTHRQTLDSDPVIERDFGSLISAGALTLRNKFVSKMDSPVTNRKTDTLKKVMRKLLDTNAGFSFLVDNSNRATGIVTLRDIIIQFAPPCVDSRINGGGFFDSALEQSGCRIVNRKMIRNNH